MSDTAGRCGWVARGDEDEVAEIVGVPAYGTYETWGLIGWPLEPGSSAPITPRPSTATSPVS